MESRSVKRTLVIERRDALVAFLVLSFVAANMMLFKGHDEYVFGLGMLTGAVALFVALIASHVYRPIVAGEMWLVNKLFPKRKRRVDL